MAEHRGTDLALVDARCRILKHGPRSSLKIDEIADLALGPVRARNDALAPGYIDAHGLRHVHMLTCIDSCRGVLRMEIRRRLDNDAVHLGRDQILVPVQAAIAAAAIDFVLDARGLKRGI